ncbi:solute carrier organic anion transporter family member 2B1 isoform 3-T3 [Aulostomus maculatus]
MVFGPSGPSDPTHVYLGPLADASTCRYKIMGANEINPNVDLVRSRPPAGHRRPFNSVKFFVFCHSLLQLAQLLVSGYMKSSISAIERRYGLSSQKSGLLAAFNEVGNTILIIFVSFLGSRVHRPRFIGGGALLACLASLLMALPHFLGGPYKYTNRMGCILLAVTSIGPAFGFITGSFMLRFYVDFDKLSKDKIQLHPKDLRWVGAWWLGFLVASCLLFLAALPYFFFPRIMPKEDADDDIESRPDSCKQQQQQPDLLQEQTLVQFLKSFPCIALRTLRGPIYLLVVLAQVNLAALLAGLATFMAKFIERQFNQTTSFSIMMIGGVCIPLAVLGTVLGGFMMRRLNLSTSGASRLCFTAILLCMCSAIPLLFIGCPTQQIAGVFPPSTEALACSSGCGCPPDAFMPVCGSDRMEFRSPCHAGCVVMETDGGGKIINFTECRCVSGFGSASPGTCGSGCSHLLPLFVALLGVTSFIASFSQTPSYMMILRTVPTEDKSLAIGVQHMMFRVLAFMPGPVLYGKVIDTTCILWGRECGRQTSCLYYNLDLFRSRFLGLQVVFVCGALLCFLLTIVVLCRRAGCPNQESRSTGGYELVDGQKTLQNSSEKELRGIKT